MSTPTSTSSPMNNINSHIPSGSTSKHGPPSAPSPTASSAVQAQPSTGLSAGSPSSSAATTPTPSLNPSSPSANGLSTPTAQTVSTLSSSASTLVGSPATPNVTISPSGLTSSPISTGTVPASHTLQPTAQTSSPPSSVNAMPLPTATGAGVATSTSTSSSIATTPSIRAPSPPSTSSPATPGAVSGVSTTTTTPRDISLWKRALENIQRKDPKACKILGIVPMTIDEQEFNKLLEDIKNAHKVFEDKPSFWRLDAKTKKRTKINMATVVLYVDKFKAVGDTVVQWSPVHLALPWAGVRFLLTVATAHIKAKVALLESMGHIVPCLYRCTMYELQYLDLGKLPTGDADTFRNVLVRMYEVILEYFVYALHYLHRNKAFQFLSGQTIGGTTAELIARLNTMEDDVQKQATLAHEYFVSQIDTFPPPMKDRFNALQDTLEDMKTVQEKQLFSMSTLSKLVEDAQGHRRSKEVDELLESILSWLTITPDDDDSHANPYKVTAKASPSTRFSTLCNLHVEGTSDWLANTQEVKDWEALNGREKDFIWLRGKAGAGKSMQSAILLRDLIHRGTSDAIITSFWCAYAKGSQANCTVKSVLKDLLVQMCRKARTVSPNLMEIYQESIMTLLPASIRLNEEVLHHEILGMMEYFSLTTILIDGLDESPQPGKLFWALYRLFEASEKKIRLLVTSRKPAEYLPSNQKDVPGARIIEMSEHRIAIDSAIEQFVELKLQELGFRVSLQEEPGLRQDMINTLNSSSDGVILYASVLLQNFSQIGALHDLRIAIANPPVGLEGLFMNCLNRINDGWTFAHVSKICMWVHTVRRPLQLDEIQEAISIQTGQKRWDTDRFVDENNIIEYCVNLIQIGPNNCVEFIHKSVADFFDGNSPYPEGHTFSAFFQTPEQRAKQIVEAGITYLAFGDFSGPSESLEQWHERLSKYRFLRYTAKYWSLHIQELDHTMAVSLWQQFMRLGPAKLELFLELNFTDMKYSPKPDAGPIQQGSLSKLDVSDYTLDNFAYQEHPKFSHYLEYHMICCLGLDKLFDMLNLQHQDFDKRLASISDKGHTALYTAVARSHTAISLKLIKLMRPFTINLPTQNQWTALHMAAAFGRSERFEILQALVEGGADLRIDAHGVHPLGLAIPGKLIETKNVVEYLCEQQSDLEYVCNTKLEAKPCLSPLELACVYGNYDIVEVLIRYGASVVGLPESPRSGGCLHYSLMGGHDAIARRLIDEVSDDTNKKIFVNRLAKIWDLETGMRPMTFAKPDMAEILLGYGADPSIFDDDGFTALHRLVFGSNVETMSKFLKNETVRKCLELYSKCPVQVGADLPIPLKPLACAIHGAIHVHGNIGMVRLLLEASQASSKLPPLDPWSGTNDLQYVVTLGQVEILATLLEFGADPNEPIDTSGFPLLLFAVAQYAFVSGSSVTSQMLSAGLSTDLSTILSMIRLLIQHDANLDAANMYTLTPLHMSTRSGFVEVARILLEAGASLDTIYKGRWKPIQLCDNDAMLELFIQHGGNIEDPLTNINFCHYAATEGKLSSLQWIGSHPKYHDLLFAMTSEGRTPLELSIENNHVECVKELMKHNKSVLLPGDQFNRTILHAAAEVALGTSIEMLQAVLGICRAWAMDINTVDSRTYTALSCAVRLRNFPAAKFLLDNGANPLTPLEIPHQLFSCYSSEYVDRNITANIFLWLLAQPVSEAEVQEHENLVDLILSRDGDNLRVSLSRDTLGNTALHYAALSPEMDFLEKFENLGVDGSVANSVGHNAWELLELRLG